MSFVFAFWFAILVNQRDDCASFDGRGIAGNMLPDMLDEPGWVPASDTEGPAVARGVSRFPPTALLLAPMTSTLYSVAGSLDSTESLVDLSRISSLIRFCSSS